MKILEVVPNLQAGGAETFVVNLSNTLAQNKDVEVTILTLYPPEESEFLRKKIISRVNVINLEKHNGIDLKLPFEIMRLIKRGKYDIAHFHVQAIIYCFLSCLFIRRTRYFATIHNDAFKESCGLHRLVRKILFKAGLCRAITISEDSDKSFKKLYRTGASMINNGVVRSHKNINESILKQFNLDGKDLLFVNVASFMPNKNQLSIARAANKLINEGNNIKVLFLGKIWDENYYKEVLKETSNKVFVVGEVSNPIDYMSLANFFILPSVYEGMPISLLEAMSVDCIPIVTPVGGCRNVIQDGVNGLICPTPDVDDVYVTMKRAILMGEKNKSRIKAQIKKDFENYTIDKCTDLHIKLFEKALDE